MQLKRLDTLTQEEARMAAAQILKLTHAIDNKVRCVGDSLKHVDNNKIDIVIKGKQAYCLLLALHVSARTPYAG
jgi:hypothetical protein